MNDLLNSLSQMQTIEVFFWFLLVVLSAVVIASMIGCIARAWYLCAPRSFGLFLVIGGSCLFWYLFTDVFINFFTK